MTNAEQVEFKRLKSRQRVLEKALRGLLAVSVPSEDPKGRTAMAMKKAQRALRRLDVE